MSFTYLGALCSRAVPDWRQIADARFQALQFWKSPEWVDTLKQKGDVTGESDRDSYRAFPIPVGVPLAKTYTDSVLVSGDAGGFVNAFTAEGIFYTMTSGSIAADTWIAAIKAQTAVK